ncbi:asparaginyl-tRNA synthetase [Diplocarpon rosae]|nr:asparaginyl-tRNA synthetase [Diplocarpon rosae]
MSVRLTGAWTPSAAPSAHQSHELVVEDVNVYGSADPATYPLQKKWHTPEFLRTMPHLRVRTQANSTLLRLRSDAIATVTGMFHELGFTQTHTPIITSSDCEGAGEVFHVGRAPPSKKHKKGDDGTFFKGKKYLTVSSQLHLEALAQSAGNVWTLSPTFRAEKSDTARHLSEFYMLEAEVNFTENLEDVMKVVQSTVCSITENLLSGSKTATELMNLATRERKAHTGLKSQLPHGETDAEKQMMRRAIKPFYMLPSRTSAEGRETVDCFDLLVPEACEIAGGSMREHRLAPLIESMQARKMIPSDVSSTELDFGDLKWYVDLRRWGSAPHGGFGLGFDRLLGYLAHVPNIREVVAFPRWVGRCDC